MFVAPVPCLPAQISEGLSKTIVQQACNLIDVEKRNAGHFETAKGESREIGILQTNAFSASSPLGRCGLCWPITLRRRIASIHLVRELDEEDHSVCLNLKSSWGRTNTSIPRIRVPSKKTFAKLSIGAVSK